MDQGLLRGIVIEYLVPLFSGAQLEDRAENSNRREGLVATRDPLRIAFKVSRNDDYRLVLSRPQPFAKTSEANLPEIDVVQAFVDVVAHMADALNSPLKDDLLSTFQRRIVARAIGLPNLEPLVLSGIDQLANWGAKLYEGAPIAASIGFSDNTQRRGTVKIGEIAAQDFGAVMGNGYDTLMEFDFQGRFVSHDALEFDSDLPSFCPLRQAAISGWTTTGEDRIALSLNRLGEILAFRKGQLLFARRSGRWHFLTHDPVISQMAIPRGDRSIRLAIYETCLDASFARTGACIGVIAGAHTDEWQRLVAEEDQLQNKGSVKTRAISKMIRGRKFNQLDRRLRQELSAVDGATVLSHKGELLAVGAILRITGGSTGGGRLAAAKALSRLGLGIKVSQDGGISGFRERHNTPVFRVM